MCRREGGRHELQRQGQGGVLGQGRRQGGPGGQEAAIPQGGQEFLCALLHRLPLGIGELQHIAGANAALPFLQQGLKMAGAAFWIEAMRWQGDGAGGADQQAGNGRFGLFNLEAQVQGGADRGRGCNGCGPGQWQSVAGRPGSTAMPKL